MFGRNKIAMLAAEFLGAGALTLVVVSVQRSTIGVPYFVGLAGGLAVAMLLFVFGRVSGAHMNPAITIGMWTARRITTVKAILYVVVQLLGAYLAGLLYQYLINNDVSAVSSDFTGRLLVAETVGAVILSLGWAAAVYRNFETGTKSAVAGISYALGIIVASAASVGIVNPAVALGANAWGWMTYVLGPVLGGIIGFNLYGLLFAPAGAVVKTARPVGEATTTRPVVVKETKTRRVAKTATKAKASTRKKTAKK